MWEVEPRTKEAVVACFTPPTSVSFKPSRRRRHRTVLVVKTHYFSPAFKQVTTNNSGRRRRHKETGTCSILRSSRCWHQDTQHSSRWASSPRTKTPLQRWCLSRLQNQGSRSRPPDLTTHFLQTPRPLHPSTRQLQPFNYHLKFTSTPGLFASSRSRLAFPP